MNRFLTLLALTIPLTASADPVATIRAVGKEGNGNAAAALAWKELVAGGPTAISSVLKGMDGATPTAANWLRLAGEAIAETEAQAGKPLPAGPLEAYVADVKNGPMSRRFAYELLRGVDAKAPERLLPTMLEDASPELRRDAVAQAMGPLLTAKEPDVKKLQSLFTAARDKAQVEKLAEALKKSGAEPNIPAHFGILMRWHLIGPFDSTGGTGFNKIYPPETSIELTAEHPGKAGKPVRWITTTTDDPFGLTDLNKALGKHKDAIAYAYAEVTSEKEQAVEIRFGCVTSYRLIVNGKELAAREEFHHGERFDQYVAPAMLKPGRNTILMKIGQNNQTEDWAQAWKFRLRISDAVGGTVPFMQTVPAK